MCYHNLVSKKFKSPMDGKINLVITQNLSKECANIPGCLHADMTAIIFCLLNFKNFKDLHNIYTDLYMHWMLGSIYFIT